MIDEKLVHYQPLDNGGMRAAFIAWADGDPDDIDATVRNALGMEHTEIVSPRHINTSLPYIVDGEKMTVYHSTRLNLQNSTATVCVHKDNKPIEVGINCGLVYGERMQKTLITVAIKQDFEKNGIIPVVSERKQISPTFLKKNY